MLSHKLTVEKKSNQLNAITVLFAANRKKNLILIEKEELLKFFSEGTLTKVYKIKTIFLNSHFRFGNQFMLFNKVIFYCEILGCKRIIIKRKFFWYIKNIIYNYKNNMIIKPSSKFIKYPFIIFDSTFIFFKYINIFKPEFKVNLLKKEIIKNLPKLKLNINKNDLMIYIRSGDIFNKSCSFYSQPPFCFYQKILLNFNFKTKYIISEDKRNPVINLLLNKFPGIVFNKNNLKLDMVYLLNAYNIVITKSTFIICIIQFNHNLEKLYEFDLNFEDQFDKEIRSFNYYNNNFNIYRMNSSRKYKIKMKNWKNNKYQINLMKKEKCPYNFTIIK